MTERIEVISMERVKDRNNMRESDRDRKRLKKIMKRKKKMIYFLS